MSTEPKVIENERAFTKWVEDTHRKYRHHAKIIFISGELGAGKTTFTREWLRLCGEKGRIKSPSFSIVESYRCDGYGEIHHIDLYRIEHKGEVLSLGLESYMHDRMIIEWPEKGAAEVLLPDLWISIKIVDNSARAVKYLVQPQVKK